MLRQVQHERIREALTKLVRSPLALSSLRSGCVEGLYPNQLPNVG